MTRWRRSSGLSPLGSSAPGSSTPSASGRRPWGSRKAITRSRSSRTIEKAPRRRGRTSAIASSIDSAGCVAISAAMISESEVELNVTPRASSSSCSSTALIRLPLCASASSRRGAVGALRALDGLGVLPGVGAGRGVADVADRELAGERAQVVLAEHLADEPELAARDDVPAAVGRGDARPTPDRGAEARTARSRTAATPRGRARTGRRHRTRRAVRHASLFTS